MKPTNILLFAIAMVMGLSFGCSCSNKSENVKKSEKKEEVKEKQRDEASIAPIVTVGPSPPTITAKFKRPSDARNAIVKGVVKGDPAHGQLEGAWVHTRPVVVLLNKEEIPPDNANACFYKFPTGYGIWYRPMPLDPDGKFEMYMPLSFNRWWLCTGATGYAEACVKVDLTHEDVELDNLQLTWIGIGRVRIRALFKDGTPISSRSLHVEIKSSSNASVEDEALSNTDDEGYALFFVKPGSYKLRIKDPPPGSPTVDFKINDGELRDLVFRVGLCCPLPSQEK